MRGPAIVAGVFAIAACGCARGAGEAPPHVAAPVVTAAAPVAPRVEPEPSNAPYDFHREHLPDPACDAYFDAVEACAPQLDAYDKDALEEHVYDSRLLFHAAARDPFMAPQLGFLCRSAIQDVFHKLHCPGEAPATGDGASAGANAAAHPVGDGVERPR